MTTLKSGLIQMSLKGSTEDTPEQIRDAMLAAHLPLIDKAGAAGVQILCFQEVFTQPYFCPSQDAKVVCRRRSDPWGLYRVAHAGVRQEAQHGHYCADL